MGAADQSFMQQYGSTLVDNGYSIIPIKPGEKAPWAGLKGWQEYCNRLPPTREVEQWEGYSGAGIGLPCGYIVGIDIDIEDGALSHRVGELARLRLGDTPALRIGKHPKQLLVYRVESPFASFDAKPLQVLALGRQFVGYGYHPDTGAPYQWPLGNLLEISRDNLPVVTEQQVRGWLAEAVKLLPGDMKAERAPAPAGAGGVQEPATYEAVESALRVIPSDGGTSRAAWIEIGMAIKAGLGQDGVHLWHEWSARDDSRYTAKESDAQWASFKPKPGGIGVGTLFDRARLNGWYPDAGIFLFARDKDAVQSVSIDFQALMANALKRQGGIVRRDDHDDGQAITEAQANVPAPKYTVSEGEPGWMRDLDGSLRMFVDYTRSQSHRDQPLLALAVALPTFGTIAGRRYKTETGLLSNVYTVGIGGSASGKEMGLNVSTRLFNEAGLANMLGGEELASGRAIISTLGIKPACFFALDEFGKMLGRVTNPRSRSANDADIFKVLLSMFSASQRVYGGVEYADKKEKATSIIQNPCLSIYGPTTGSTFWGALSSGEGLDGSLARMLVFETENSYPPQRRIYQRDMPPELVDAARRIAAGVEGHNHFPMADCAATAPNPYAVRMDTQAIARDDELMAYQDELLLKYKDTAGETIYGRMREIILKVALIRAITSSESKPVITVPYFDWASSLVIDRVAHMVAAMNLNLADNEGQKNMQLLLRIIVDTGKMGASRSHISKKVDGRIPSRTRADILSDLIESGRVRAENIGSNGGAPKVVYFAT